jgi:hypothetical protein
VDVSEAAILFADGTFTALIGSELRIACREAALADAAAAREVALRDTALRLVFAAGLVGRFFFTELLFMEQL